MASQWLYIARPTRPEMLQTGPTELEERIIAAHAAHVAKLAASGTIFLAGRTQTTTEDTMGLVLLLADSEDEARAIMNADPAITGGVMSGQLFPYKVAFGNAAVFAEALGQGLP